MTVHTTDGRTVRRRNCIVCNARWYTLQSKEEYLSDNRIQYIMNKRTGEQKIKLLDEPS